MRRGEFYRVRRATVDDPRRSRVFVVVSRQVLLDSRFSTAVCAPVYSAYEALSTQVPVGPDEGLKHHSGILCDELVSLPKSLLTDYVGCLSAPKLQQLDQALKVALQIEEA